MTLRIQGWGGWVPVGLAFLSAFATAVFLSPHLFNGLLALGRAVPAAEFLRDTEFEKVFGRTFVLTLLISFAAFASLRGRGAWESLGFRRGGNEPARFAVGLALGVATMAVLYIVGLASGAYHPAPGTVASRVVAVTAALAGALLVGLVEEAVFRGGLFGGLQESMGSVAAAVVSSFIFAVLHFAEPVPLAGVVRGHWDSGLRMVPDLFRGLLTGTDVQPFILTVFVMALVLCLFFRRQGSIYFIIGLHAGWVWVIGAGGALLAGVGEPGPFLRDPGAVARGYLALAVMLVFALAAAGWQRGRRT